MAGYYATAVRGINRQFLDGRPPGEHNGKPVKFLTLADWTGMAETELFAQTYKGYGLATVLRAGKPRTNHPSAARK